MQLKTYSRFFALHITLFVLQLNLHGQTAAWQWINGGGGSGYASSNQTYPDPDNVNQSAIDSKGNIIAGGEVTSSPKFGAVTVPNLFGNWGGGTMFLTKYNSCGDLVWKTIAGGTSSDNVAALTIDRYDNIYTVGTSVTNGTNVRISCPAFDTLIPNSVNSLTFFAKWDSNGNLLYIRNYPFNINSLWYVANGQMKVLRDGRILAMLGTNSATTNIINIPVISDARYFALFDTLGSIQKIQLIDTTLLYYNSISGFVLDEAENIYFTLTNVDRTSLNILGTTFSPAQQTTGYLVKTDTSFVIKNYKTGYLNEVIAFLAHNNNSLYSAGRSYQGAFFDYDTVTPPYDNFITAYGLDTSLNLQWVSRATQQLSDVGYMKPIANDSSLFLPFKKVGTLTWGANTHVTPPNSYSLVFAEVSTQSGICNGITPVSGSVYFTDEFTQSFIDLQGNPHFVGSFRQNLTVAGNTIFANTGLTSPDFFILKWGLPCTDTLNSLNSPEAPDALIATAFSSTDVNIEWHNNATYRLGFKLYRSPDGTSNWQQIATTAHNVYSYNDGNLNPATTYWYRVAAYTTGGDSPFSNIDSATTFGSVCSAAITRTNADSVYTFNANPTGFGTLSYQWSKNGTAFSSAATPSLTLGTPGSYSICVTVTDAGGCTATDCDTVVISPFVCNSTLAYTHADSVYSFTTTASGTAPFTYAWSKNGIAFSGGATAQQTLSMAGNYNICVTITDANNCQSSDCQSITIAPPPTCGTSVNSSSSGAVYTFTTTNTGTAPFSYQWSSNGTAFSTSSPALLSLSAAGNYNICVTVTDANNCTATACENIIISGLEKEPIREVELYPNPVNEWLFAGVWANEDKEVIVQLFDMNGRLVLHTTQQVSYGKNLLRIETDALIPGVYEMTLHAGEQTWRGRVLKANH